MMCTAVIFVQQELREYSDTETKPHFTCLLRYVYILFCYVL
uniref:Uncharacterized protein n=1 Tax=Anguilla anguilla TaxID=7936 RepID=A0A0E9PXK6_ANGAN